MTTTTGTIEQRVYLLRAHSVELGPGNIARYAAGYYNLPADQAEQWIREGLALPAAEYEKQHAQAAAAAAADPMMHLAGPVGPVCEFCAQGKSRVQLTDGTVVHEFSEGRKAWCEPCVNPAPVPAGAMWAQGPKGSEIPAVAPPAVPASGEAVGEPAAAPAGEPTEAISGVQTSAQEE